MENTKTYAEFLASLKVGDEVMINDCTNKECACKVFTIDSIVPVFTGVDAFIIKNGGTILKFSVKNGQELGSEKSRYKSKSLVEYTQEAKDNVAKEKENYIKRKVYKEKSERISLIAEKIYKMEPSYNDKECEYVLNRSLTFNIKSDINSTEGLVPKIIRLLRRTADAIETDSILNPLSDKKETPLDRMIAKDKKESK